MDNDAEDSNGFSILGYFLEFKMLICVDDKTKSYQPTTLGAEYICPSMRLDIVRVLFCVVMDPDKVKVQKKNQGLHPLFSASKPTIHLLFSASKPQFIQSLSRRANARNVSF